MPGCGSESPLQGRLHGAGITGTLVVERGHPTGIRRPRGSELDWCTQSQRSLQDSRVPWGCRAPCARAHLPCLSQGLPQAPPTPSCGFAWLDKRVSRGFLVLVVDMNPTHPNTRRFHPPGIPRELAERRLRSENDTACVPRGLSLPAPVAMRLRRHHRANASLTTTATPHAVPLLYQTPSQALLAPHGDRAQLQLFPQKPALLSLRPELRGTAGGNKAPVWTTLIGQRGFRGG